MHKDAVAALATVIQRTQDGTMAPSIRLLTFMCLAAHSAAHAQAGRIQGTVHDSLHGVPLANATVIAVAGPGVRDTVFRSALADARGSFRIEGLFPGRYIVSVTHDMMDSIGVGLPDREVVVQDAGLVQLSLSTPSSATLRRTICPSTADSATGVILGVVRRLDGRPAAGATVVLTWNDFEVDARAASVMSRRMTTNTRADTNGVYRQCGLPLARSVFVQAQGANRGQSGILEERIGVAGVQVRDFRIDDAPVMAAALPESLNARRAVLAGVITDVRDRPVSSAQVALTGTGRTVSTNARGEFRLPDVALGTHSIEVLALGYYPRSVHVELDRATLPLTVRMERTAVILDSLQVIARRSVRAKRLFHEAFETRRGNGFGTFFGKATLDSMRPQTVWEVFRRAPSVKLAQQSMGWQTLLVSSRGMTSFDGPLCPLDVYLDGIQVQQSDIAGLPPEVIYGVEIHTVATAPPKYKIGKCGAVFFWTR
jgi:hypothetical protein